MKDHTKLQQKTPIGPNHEQTTIPWTHTQGSVEKFPDFKSWYAEGYVNKPRDQASCGACWAFTAASTLESLAFINGFDKYLQRYSI